MSTSNYIKSFFERGRIIINEKTIAENKRMFKSVLIKLNTEHEKFVQECTKENILKIDHKNMIIEVVVL